VQAPRISALRNVRGRAPSRREEGNARERRGAADVVCEGRQPGQDHPAAFGRVPGAAPLLRERPAAHPRSSDEIPQQNQRFGPAATPAWPADLAAGRPRVRAQTPRAHHGAALIKNQHLPRRSPAATPT
jgi:hypothetical protein